MAFQPREAPRSEELILFAKKLTIIVAFAIGLLILWAARGVLILIFIAAALAAGIAPAVQRVRIVTRHLLHRNISRGAAVLIVYFPFVLLMLVLILGVAPRLVDETRVLGAQFPSLLERNILTPLDRYVPMAGVRAYLRKNGLALPDARLFGVVRSTVSAVASFVAVAFMVVYMLIDAHRLRNLVLLFYPPELRGRQRRIMTRIARRMSWWLSGQFFLSAIIGVATFVGLALLQIPFALPLAIFATIGEMVPVIGPIVGTAPALAVSLLHSKWQFWSVLIMVIVLQKAENLVIAPRVMARRVSMSPLTAFIAFMIGAAVLGIVGALMAIPAAAVVQVVFEETFVEQRERRRNRDRAGTLLWRRD